MTSNVWSVRHTLNYLRDVIAKDVFLEALNYKEMELVVCQSQIRSLQQDLGVAVEYEIQLSRQHRVPNYIRECVTETEMSANHENLALRLGQLQENIDKILKITTDETKVSEKAPKAGKKCFSCGKDIFKLIVPMLGNPQNNVTCVGNLVMLCPSVKCRKV